SFLPFPMNASKSIWYASLLLLAPLVLNATPARTWSVIETGRDNAHRLSPVAAPPVITTATTGSALALDPAQRFQEMVGFVGALTESSAWVLAQVTAEKRAEILRRYYDPKEGLGYTLAR